MLTESPKTIPLKTAPPQKGDLVLGHGTRLSSCRSKSVLPVLQPATSLNLGGSQNDMNMQHNTTWKN